MSHIAGARNIKSPKYSSDDFFTPVGLFNRLHDEFQFTLDPCGHEKSPASNTIGTYWTANGLTDSWLEGGGTRVFVNPPYSHIEPWVAKAHKEAIRGCPLVVMLLPANKTEQPWWQRYIEPFRDSRRHALYSIETRFIAGRLAHGTPDDPEGVTSSSGTFASVICVWRRA